LKVTDYNVFAELIGGFLFIYLSQVTEFVCVFKC